MSKLQELRQALSKAVTELNTDEIVADQAKFDVKKKEVDDLEAQIARVMEAEKRSAALARPAVVTGAENPNNEVENGMQRTLSSLVSEAKSISRREARPIVFDDCLSIARRGLGFTIDKSKHFSSLGEQLQAIFTHYASKGTNTDSRLVRAPSGASEVDATGGGFLVQVDFIASIFMLAHDMGVLLNRVNKIPVSANANGIKIPGIDETSRATGSRWGGVQSNWAAEGVAGTESRPKFRMVEFDLKKLISKMTVTDELLADSTALSAIAAQAFSEEVMFMTEDAIFEGSGAGQPLGFLNSPALVTQNKESGQTNGTIVKQNIDNMWSRMWSRSRANAVWLINQDCEPQLNQMNQQGTSGGIQLVYLPPGGLSAAPYGSLYGRPVITTEYNNALGAPGDIALVDLSQYTLVDKGGVQMASSMHVAFDTDEMRFRVTYRVDGKPMWHAPLTPFKGSNARSPFVVLQQR